GANGEIRRMGREGKLSAAACATVEHPMAINDNSRKRAQLRQRRTCSLVANTLSSGCGMGPVCGDTWRELLERDTRLPLEPGNNARIASVHQCPQLPSRCGLLVYSSMAAPRSAPLYGSRMNHSR